MTNRHLVTGCSSGGKSTLIGVLSKRGFDVVEEPGLRIIRSGGPLPWDDLTGFIDAVIKQSKADLEEYSDAKHPTFFDRGLFDALSGFAARNKVPLGNLLPDEFSFAQPVFYVPPWPEIFVNTAERRLSMAVAIEEAERIKRDLIAMNIDYVEVPKIAPEARADFVLSYL